MQYLNLSREDVLAIIKYVARVLREVIIKARVLVDENIPQIVITTY